MKKTMKPEEVNPNSLPLSLPLPANTTEQDDMITAGQRKVNLIWEYTQAFIAITVVLTTMAKALVLENDVAIPTILATAFGIVVGFYFGRTNHQKIGGVAKGDVGR